MTTTAMEPLLTPQEVAEILRVSVDTVYGHARNGLLPSVRIGNSVRFRAEDIRAVVEGRTATILHLPTKKG